MIVDPGKCPYMLVRGHAQIDYISLNDVESESCRIEALLVVVFDGDLKFDTHIKSLCRNAAQRLSALPRINKYPSYYFTKSSYL